MSDKIQRREKYGLKFPVSWSALDIELHCFKVARTAEQGGLGQAEHFWKVVDYLWGPKNPVKNSTKYFLRNPWSEDIIDQAVKERYVAVGGAAGSTKSETCGMWLLVKYLSNAKNTLGGVVSTSLKEAKKRIWGSMMDFVNAIPNKMLPLKVLPSMGIIRYESQTWTASDRSCLSLIAAERSQEKEAIGKLIGMHNYEVIIIGDELTELPESLLEYALPGGNLATNPKYQFFGLANPSGYYDTFAKLWKPVGGWTSITVDSDCWKTQHGVGLHFDCMRSPNVLDPRAPYRTPDGTPYLPTQEKIDEAATAEGGINSIRFWRMMRGFPCPAGQEDLIYSQIDIVKFKGDEPAIWGDGVLIRVAALDPGFTNGGDRTILYFGTLGRDKNGQLVLQFDETVELLEDVTNNKVERSYQIAQQLKDQCALRNVDAFHCAIDSTGAGSPFCDVVSHVWSSAILRVNFGGAASELPVSLVDVTPGNEKYHDRVSEIWYSGKELLRQGQLKGIAPKMAVQMCARKYGITGIKKRIYVESKIDMKSRTLESPDYADAGFVLVTLCRERFGLVPVFSPEATNKPQRDRSWRQIVDARSARLSRPNNLGGYRRPATVHPEVG